MTKPVILTGLRANNDLTLGNYFGGMLPIIDMAMGRSSDYQINMFIPDLHSFTTPIDHSQLQEQIMNNARLFTAAGLPLDNDSIYLYRQSYVSAHSEMTWILDNFTGFGEMTRMTQFKDKSKLSGTERLDIYNQVEKIKADFEKQEIDIQDASNWFNIAIESVIDYRRATTSVGLFNYPVLMAADILLYDATYVPVGDDQTQHLEYTRDVAERINKKFGDILTVPEPVQKQHEFFGKGQGLRIKDLMNPEKKMSKSDESGKGVIFLTDEPVEAAKKVMSATTDDKASVNYDPENQPGISNLLQILSLLRNQPMGETENEFKGMDRYGDFKKIVADEVATFLTNFQSRLSGVDDEAIIAKLEASETAMNIQANKTLYTVQQAVGLRPKAGN